MSQACRITCWSAGVAVVHVDARGRPVPGGLGLTALLAHMVDGFTAFVEGSAGWLMPTEPGPLPLDAGLLSRRLLDLGCAILGGWTTADGRDCRLGLLHLPADMLLEVAALEITVHGWDVSRVCAPDRRMPPALAAALLPVALRHVTPSDRPARFGPAPPA